MLRNTWSHFLAERLGDGAWGCRGAEKGWIGVLRSLGRERPAWRGRSVGFRSSHLLASCAFGTELSGRKQGGQKP